MTAYYMDTSALAKRYIVEQGSDWVRTIIAPNTIVICDITPIEIFSVLKRKQIGGTLTLSEADNSRNGFLAHYRSEYIAVRLSDSVLIRARNLVTAHRRLRTLDAIQLSSAMEFATSFAESIIFMTADKDLNAAAVAEGFTTDNPENHP